MDVGWEEDHWTVCYSSQCGRFEELSFLCFQSYLCLIGLLWMNYKAQRVRIAEPRNKTKLAMVPPCEAYGVMKPH